MISTKDSFYYVWTVILTVVLSYGMNLSETQGQSNAKSLKFSNISNNDGLSQSSIRDILQDKEGFIWIATKNGLNRYDGFDFERLFHDPVDSTTLSGNDILSLALDSEGDLWIGTTAGLNTYSVSDGQFREVDFATCDNIKFPDRISDIQIDALGRLWLAHFDGGLSIISADGGTNSSIDPICANDRFLRNSLCLHSDGEFMYVGSEEGLLKVDIQDWTVEFYPVLPDQERILHRSRDSVVAAIVAGEDADELWLGKIGGVARFNKRTGASEVFLHPTLSQTEYIHRISNVHFDDDLNLLWLAGTPGLTTFDLQSRRFVDHPYADETLMGEASGSVHTIFESDDGCIWLGTNGYGVDIFSPSKNRFNQFSCSTCKHKASGVWGFPTRTIFEDDEGTVWFSSNGLYKWNRETNKIRNYRRADRPSTDFGNTQIWSIVRDNEGYLWMAGWEGLFKYDAKNEHVVHFRHEPNNANSLPEKVAFELFIDSQSNLWVLTNSYISLFDRETETFTSFEIDDRIAPDVNTYVSVVEYDGLFYIGTGIGLLQFNPKSGEKKWYRSEAGNPDRLSNDVIRSLYLNTDSSKDILWIGTAGGGLNRFDLKSGTFEHFTMKDGLPDNVVYGVLQDNSGYLWMSTNKGLSRFHPATKTFTNFDVEDGLQGNEFNSGSYFKSNSGELFFGGLNGFNYFYPEEVKISEFEPNVVITSFRIEDKKLNPDGNALSTAEINNLQDAIVLHHNENIFQFTFSALDYNDPDAIEYQYMLQGWDKDFIQSNNKRSAIYSNVSDGSYTFLVRGSNSDGIWSTKEARLSIVIKPPWWRTHAAIVVYLLIGLFVLLYFREEYLDRLRLKNKLAYEHMQTEKLREIDEIKTRFFSNVSHEFRTPLTIILSPLDDLMKSTKNVKNVETLKMIKANASRLLGLVNQLMDLAKIQHRTFKLNPVKQPLAHFIRRLCLAFEPIASKQGITIHVRSSLGDRLVPFDRDSIEKIVTNLVSNACKFSAQNGNIYVDVDVLGQDGTQVIKLSVKDEGIGMTADQMQHIFDRFYQVNENLERAVGTGIGLSLVKELVDLHKGEITVDSRLGLGSTFTLLLPAEGVELNGQPMPSVASEKLIAEKPLPIAVMPDAPISLIDDEQSEPPIIMIIDDHKDIRQLIENTLGDKYLHVHAADGKAGLEQALKIVPDLIISDIMMPGMDGYELCHQLKDHMVTSHVPVILLTAKASRHSKLDGLKLGADAYLTKPFDTDELRIRVEQLIHMRRLLAERYASNEQSTMPKELDEVIRSEDAFLTEVNEHILANLSNAQYGVTELIRDVRMSRSQLYRKIKALTNRSIIAYIRLVRLRESLSVLKQGHKTISEVAYDVGFTDPAYFSRVFSQEFGKSPSHFQQHEA